MWSVEGHDTGNLLRSRWPEDLLDFRDPVDLSELPLPTQVNLSSFYDEVAGGSTGLQGSS